MNWFEEQLQYREKTDNADFTDALDSIVSAIMGARLQAALSQNEIAESAIDEILRFYRCKTNRDELPRSIHSVEEQIEYRMRPFGIKNRTVTLEKGWYHHAIGAMIGTMKEDGAAVALIPKKFSGYTLINIVTGKRMSLNQKTEKLLDKQAICFYESLPQKALTSGDLMRFLLHQLSVYDILLFLVLMGISALLGMLAPLFTKWLFSDVLESGSIQILVSLAIFMICFTISSLFFRSFQALISARIETKQSIAVQAAVMSRLMSLSPDFYKQYSAGELSKRASYAQSLCSTIFSTIGTTGVTSLFSLIYMIQIFSFAPTLVVPALSIVIATVILSLATTYVQIKITRSKMEFASKTSGVTYATITGIQKIKLAGAEKRMFSRWARAYAKEAQMEYNPPTFLKLSDTLRLALSLIGTLVLYTVAIKTQVAVADYYAFNTAYGFVSSAFMAVVTVAVNVANIRPALEMVKPILEAAPEMHDGKENIASLHGGIELSHLSFRYDESMPYVIDDLSLEISSGEYLAVVGSTGCGKTTLMRLLLGFETPQKGSVLYDKKDISGIDLEALRKKIGVVMQDSKLFLGDIYSNILITAPQLGMEAAWEAARIASIADDIEAMPMKMHTFIGEGHGGISGGQKQRLMIARAIAPKPKILIFDEATSALDNITQRKISKAIDALDCTRIVIAHRLSTIQHADRIIYLDQGKIVEEGTYEELIAKNGYFAKLVERQRLEFDDAKLSTENVR